MSIRFYDRPGILFVYLETNLSCLLYIRNSFFPPLKKISIFEKRFLLSSLSDADRWKIIGSSWFPREDFSRVCSSGWGMIIERSTIFHGHGDARPPARPTAMKYLWREHRGTATMKRINSPPIQFVNASLITLLYDPL